MNPYSGNEHNFPNTLLMPDDLDPAAAGSWLPALEGLADRTRALRPVYRQYFPTIADILFGSWGTFGWTKPIGSMFHRFIVKGGGGGGAGGLAVVGAGGGGAGELIDVCVPDILVPDTLTITVGAGGQPGTYGIGSPDPTGKTGGASRIIGSGNFSLEADGGWGALQKPTRLSGTWPPSPIHEGIGGVGRGYDLLMLSAVEHMSPGSSAQRARGGMRGANGGAGEWIGNNPPRAGGAGETDRGGLPGGDAGNISGDDGEGGIGAGAGGGGSRSRTTAAKGGGGAGGYRWLLNGARFKAEDGAFLPGTPDVWRGGKGAPGVVIILSFRGALT